MKKQPVFFAVSCCIMLFLTACGVKERKTETIVAEPVKADDKTDNSTVEKPEETADTAEEKAAYPEGYQIKAFRFYGQDYVFLNKTLYKITSAQEIDELLTCGEAVGQKRDEYLFWGIWDAEHILRIIRLDAKGTIFEVGKLKEKYPPAALDFYGDTLYIRYKLGNVEGYRIGADGKIAAEASAEEMALYDDENKAAEIRQNEPDAGEDIQRFPYHIMGAGYSKEICGKEFLARHVPHGESGEEEFIVRSGVKDTVLFTYYEDAFINREYVIYCNSVDKNKLSIYDMQKKMSRDIYEFTDGTFELLTADNNRIYGIWRSIGRSKDFLAGIDIDTAEMHTYLEMGDKTKCQIINDTIYYVDPADDGIVRLSVNGS